MDTASTLTHEKLENLILDVNNPRFAELYSGSNKEDDLIEYLLYTEAAEDIAKAIEEVKEFYPDEPLWVLKKDGKYLVKDGNRRCAAAKSLLAPNKYQLGVNKFELYTLPILIFEDEDYLNQRIREKHASSLFREWERIAKALQVHSLYTSGSSIDSMKEIDSNPNQLVKLGSFYHASVKIEGESLKKLLRRGRGKTGGKTIIFERLFKYSKLCGYGFKNKPSYELTISDKKKFAEYISAMVKYLEANPKTTHKTVDTEGEKFLNKLEQFGFKKKQPSPKKKKESPKEEESNDEEEENKNSTDSAGASTETNTSGEKKGSVKHNPEYERKGVPSGLDRLIKECFSLDHDNFSNAKTALSRVTFECALKYIVENTKYEEGVRIADSSFFRRAFPPGQFTNFTELKKKFTELIVDTGMKNAFMNFNLDTPHQIIHNYHVGAIPNDAKGLCDNLMPLLEFMLQDEADLLASLDLTKL